MMNMMMVRMKMMMGTTMVMAAVMVMLIVVLKVLVFIDERERILCCLYWLYGESTCKSGTR